MPGPADALAEGVCWLLWAGTLLPWKPGGGPEKPGGGPESLSGLDPRGGALGVWDWLLADADWGGGGTLLGGCTWKLISEPPCIPMMFVPCTANSVETIYLAERCGRRCLDVQSTGAFP